LTKVSGFFFVLASDSSMELQPLTAYQRYQQLQRYVNWTPEDAARVKSLVQLVRPYFSPLVDDFYAEIENHPEASKVITEGNEQIARLKTTLSRWLEELFSGEYGQDYVERRWRVGYRHVEIGLLQVYANAALSRLRRGLLGAVEKEWKGDFQELLIVRESLNTLLDLDLAIIGDAYQTEFQRRQAIAERQLSEREIMRLSGDLAGSEARYRLLFESTLDGLFILSDDSQIVAANPAACHQLGLEDGALEGKSLSSLVIRTETICRPAVWDDFFRCDKPAGECRLLRPDTVEIDVEYRTAMSFTPGLNLLSLRDVTSRKQAEERARQAGRLAAIGETMAALVHESRNAQRQTRTSSLMPWPINSAPCHSASAGGAADALQCACSNCLRGGIT
jgi:PAS domain S-box-containing protein